MRGTVQGYLEQWHTLRLPARKPRTLEREEQLIDQYITPSIGHLPLKALKPHHIAQLLADIAATGHTRTAEQVYVLLRSAMDAKFMAGVQRPLHEAQERRVLTPEEQRTLKPYVMADTRALEILLAWQLGMRRGEIRGLRWQDVDWSARQLHIRNQRQRVRGRDVDLSPKSKAGRRDLPITGDLMRLFRARAATAGYVTDLSDSGLRTAFQRVCARASVPYVGLHGFRHTMATNAIRGGVSLRVLQRMLGHQSVTTTAAIYAHVDADMIADSVGRAWKCT